jgi:hypothetical protein
MGIMRELPNKRMATRARKTSRTMTSTRCTMAPLALHWLTREYLESEHRRM